MPGKFRKDREVTAVGSTPQISNFYETRSEILPVNAKQYSFQ
jgi:hypothetical protein